jgi:molecular chaperone IbpA
MAFDFTPLFRSTIGFDGMTTLFSHALEREGNGFPPYNIEKSGDDTYRIVIALAGWSRDQLEIVTGANRLVVRGHVQPEEGERVLLHRGITQSAFERVFDLADHVEVTGASMDDGLLLVHLKRNIPEALKPRRVEIGDSGGGKITDLDAVRIEKSAA